MVIAQRQVVGSDPTKALIVCLNTDTNVCSKNAKVERVSEYMKKMVQKRDGSKWCQPSKKFDKVPTEHLLLSNNGLIELQRC